MERGFIEASFFFKCPFFLILKVEHTAGLEQRSYTRPIGIFHNISDWTGFLILMHVIQSIFNVYMYDSIFNEPFNVQCIFNIPMNHCVQ